MITVGVHKGRTVKTVTVDEIASTDSRQDVIAYALAAANETRDSLYGWTVSFGEGRTSAIAYLYTD